MSKYTISIRNIINMVGRETVESWFKDYELTDYLTPNQIQKITEHGVWSKDKLAKKIVDHFFMHEIGFETIELFKRYAKSTMQEIMEEKLPIIYSNSLEYDPLVNVDFTETFERTAEGESSSQSNLQNNGSSSSQTSGTSESLDIHNQTPQTNISKQDLNAGIYAKEVDQSESSQNATGQTSSTSSQNAQSSQGTNTTERYTRTQRGNSGSLTTAQALVMQYRKSIYAVDKDIIENLNCLFMGLF